MNFIKKWNYFCLLKIQLLLKREKLLFKQNICLLVVINDIEVSENGSIENFRKLQSELQLTNAYILFISTSSWLLADKWNKEEGKMPIGSKVTVYGEKVMKMLK